MRNKVYQLFAISLFLILLLGVFPQLIFAGDISPTQLKIEYMENPLGIDVTFPRFSWKLTSNERDQQQSAYQILVASTETILNLDTGDIWDSGKISSDSTIGVEYDGNTLEKETRYYWKVKVWDGVNSPSDWSPASWFEMGLLTASDWLGNWIGHVDGDHAPYLRKTFNINKTIKKARLYITACGYYEAHVNGSRVGENVLDPGFTRYDKTHLYVTHDITSMLQSGGNAIGVELGRGFYGLKTPNVWNWHIAPWHGDPRMRCQLKIDYTDNTSEPYIYSDDSWKATAGPRYEDSIYTGDKYDANHEKPGWTTPAYDDNSWINATVMSEPSGVIKAQMMPPIKVIETIYPANVTNPAENVWLFDFQITTSGWAKLTAKAASGTEVKIRYGEYLDENGRVMSKTDFIDNGSDTNQTDHYIFKGSETEETFEPKFSYKGYRYVEVIDSSGTMIVPNLEGKVIHSDVQTIGNFSCSDALFNEIHEATRKTFLNNLHSIPTDTPMWEKNGWTGDAQLILETSMYNFDVATFFIKWLGDFKDSQNDSGAVPVVVPTAEWGYRKYPAWTGAYTLTAWNLFRFFGNKRILEDYYNSMKDFTDYIKSGTFGYSDWNVPGRTDKDELPERLYAIHLVDIMSNIAGAVENNSDATSYQNDFNSRKNTFNTSYLFSGNKYKLNSAAPFYQTNNVLPFQFNIIPEINKADVIQNVVNDVNTRDNHLHTGILGTKALMPALSDMGYNEVAYNIVKQETYPSWGYWFANGGTTLWERWEQNSRSHNHYMFGTVDQWFYEYIAGIQPDTPGFKTIKIKPTMFNNIDSASASSDTIRGLVSSSWTRDDNDGINLEVVIPPNTEAVVYVPAESESIVQEGGIPANSAVGVSFIQMNERHAVYNVKSGTYNFTSSIAGLPPMGPPGYTFCCNEGESFTFTETVDVAYGANGQFNYMYGVTGTITFDNATFGDPIFGVVKAGFYKNAVPIGPDGYTYVADEGESFTFTETVDVAYGANGQFNYMYGVTGTITFDNATFGDPIFGVVKAGFYRSSGTGCSGDFEPDGDVDGSDLDVFAADFGRIDCNDDCESDFDTDNDVDGSDIADFAADFGRMDCPTP